MVSVGAPLVCGRCGCSVVGVGAPRFVVDVGGLWSGVGVPWSVWARPGSWLVWVVRGPWLVWVVRGRCGWSVVRGWCGWSVVRCWCGCTASLLRDIWLLPGFRCCKSCFSEQSCVCGGCSLASWETSGWFRHPRVPVPFLPRGEGAVPT